MKIISAPTKDLTLSFAGVFQSATLVYQIAKLENFDNDALQNSGLSLIRLQADNIEEVYGSAAGVELGLKKLVKLFSNRPDESSKDIYQYAVAVHQLSIKLGKLHKTSDIIHRELEAIKIEFENNQSKDIDMDTIYASLADLYSRTIGYLSPRIIVQGVSEKLQHPQTVNRVRTALFAGIRSAYLWHQLNGRRWHLLFNRKDYVHIANKIISQ